jgi:hypothetical protein
MSQTVAGQGFIFPAMVIFGFGLKSGNRPEIGQETIGLLVQQ